MYERYEKLLEKNNVTNYRVSKETGITQTTLSNWKTGKITPKTSTLKKIANYFGVSVSYFTDDTEPQESKIALEFGNRLKYLRKSKGLLQEELAEIIKTTNATVSKYENGQIEPNLETLQLLADFFDVSVDYLLCKTNVRHQHEVLAFSTTGDLTEEEIEEVRKYIEFLRTKRDD